MPISTAYREWIAANVPACPSGMCGVLTAQMVEKFPELERVRGHYVCGDGRQYPHWWCVTADGVVVDPTVTQFGFAGEYVQHVGPEPTGKCINCGGYCFNGDDVCSCRCAREFEAYLRSFGRAV
jgi:hypothetical protein